MQEFFSVLDNALTSCGENPGSYLVASGVILRYESGRSLTLTINLYLILRVQRKLFQSCLILCSTSIVSNRGKKWLYFIWYFNLDLSSFHCLKVSVPGESGWCPFLLYFRIYLRPRRITEIRRRGKTIGHHHHHHHKHHHHHHHKHQGLDPLIRSVSRVTAARSNASSVFQLFSFLVVCSGTISKGFGFMAFFASGEASSVCIRLSCPVCLQSAVRGLCSHLFCGHRVCSLPEVSVTSFLPLQFFVFVRLLESIFLTHLKV